MRLSILRHAPSITGGRLAGRTDVPADCSDTAAFARAAGRLGTDQQVVCSAALRCRQTAQALGLTWDRLDPTLWEQDFGMWERLPADQLPDLGPLSTADLARHRPEHGESFDDLTARITPALQALDCDSLLVAHAGTVRAALSLVVGQAALSFAVAPLSLTILHRHGDIWSVEAVNLPISKD
jgi:alpha-ribazole phosphatase